ncbi:uncharacterized protein LOC135849843 [Planococcus citri]|uniref:uncharacterized protein LOC135849843 n=1 Tax=Planococcus citri TaxID=170843 RepID=UPI0031F920D0
MDIDNTVYFFIDEKIMNTDPDDETFNCMERIEQKYIQEAEEQEAYRYPHPSTNTPIILLLTTILLTSCATVLTCLSLMTSHWEYISWNIHKIRNIEKSKAPVNAPPYVILEPLLDDTIVKISINHFLYNNKPENTSLNVQANATVTVYFVPMNGGIWTMCVQLNEQQLHILKGIDFPIDCIYYLSSKQFKDEEHLTSTWNYRMKNVSISSALVCLILLVSAAVIGTLGIIKHQLSAILITGIMYLLAGTFALIIVLILHIKKIDYSAHQENYDNSGILNTTVSHIIDDGIVQRSRNAANMQYSKIWKQYYTAREFKFGWSYDVGIVGVLISMITSVMWIVMAKVLRYTTVGISV